MNKTRSIKGKEIVNNWVIIDANKVRLGKLATVASKLLMGKGKVTSTDNMFSGDKVIVINASKVDLNDTTKSKKTYSWHSNFPGGFKTKTITELLEKRPDYVIRQAIWGMLPKNRMGRKMMKNVRVFKDEKHDLEAQQPLVVKI